MPWGVSKWPGALDPRGLLFCNYGYKWGAFPPYLYHFQTTGALAPFDQLNSGIVLGFNYADPFTYQALLNSVWPGTPTWSYQILGFATLQTAPVDHTIQATFSCIAPGVPLQTADLYLVEPDAIAVRTVPALVPSSGSVLVPNPITVTPRIWSTPITP